MVEGEKLSLIAERELMVYDSGREEGYAEGYAESFMAGSDEALDRVIEILDNMTDGNSINVICTLNGRWVYISTTLPTDETNYEFSSENYWDGDIIPFGNVTELYVWCGGSDGISVSFNGEIIYETTNDSFEYATQHPIPITASGTYYITVHY